MLSPRTVCSNVTKQPVDSRYDHVQTKNRLNVLQSGATETVIILTGFIKLFIWCLFGQGVWIKQQCHILVSVGKRQNIISNTGINVSHSMWSSILSYMLRITHWNNNK